MHFYRRNTTDSIEENKDLVFAHYHEHEREYHRMMVPSFFEEKIEKIRS